MPFGCVKWTLTELEIVTEVLCLLYLIFFMHLKVTASAVLTTYTVNRLVKNREYQFRISAQNKYGVGAHLVSKPVIARSSYVVPDAPEQPQKSEAGCDFITIVFTKPVNDGGCEITGKKIVAFNYVLLIPLYTTYR